MELEFMELEFHAIFLFLKFDRPIPIVVFREPYSGILNGTRVSKKTKFSKSTFAITQCFKNQVLHLELDF